MKTILLLSLLLLGFASSTFAVDKAELNKRIYTLADKFEALQRQPDKSIPADLLRRARGIVLLDRTKAGFILAYQGGGGVAMVKDETTKKWSPAAFVDANEASLGLQIGGEQNFFVILLMSKEANRLLTEPKFEFGGAVRGTAGNASSGTQDAVPATDQPVVVYDNHKGLYGGALKAGAMTPDDEANRIYYETYVTMQDILFNHKVERTAAGTDLAGILDKYSNGGVAALTR